MTTNNHQPARHRRRLVSRLAVGVGAVALIGSACSTARGDLDESGQPDQVPPVELAFAEVEIGDLTGVQTNFAFRAPELFSGELIDGSELVTDAPTIVTFVQPDCPVCIEEGPKLSRAADDHPEINYVVIHSFASPIEYLDYVDQADLGAENILHIADSGGVLWQQFGITSQPSSVLVDADGAVTMTTGALGDDGLARAAALVTGAPMLDGDFFDNDNGDTTTSEAVVTEDPATGATVVDEPVVGEDEAITGGADAGEEDAGEEADLEDGDPVEGGPTSAEG